MSFNPFGKTKHPRKDVEKIFGKTSSAKVAQQLFKTDRPLYEELRADAQTLGILGEKSYFDPVTDSREKSPRVFSITEIQARAEFSEQEAREWYLRTGDEGHKNNLGKLAKDDPGKYARLREAAISYGIIPNTPSIKAPAAKDGPAMYADGKIAIGSELAAKANLPADLRVSQDDLNKIVTAVAQVELAKREAAQRAAETKSDNEAA